MTIAAPPAADSPAGEPDHPTDTAPTARYTWNLSGPQEMPVLPPTIGARIMSADTTQVLPSASDVAANPARTRVPYGEYQSTPAPALKPGYLTDDTPDPASKAPAMGTEWRREELTAWWHAVANGDLEMLLPKAAEYSAHDLRMTGHVLADMMDIEPVSDAFAAELACAVYLMSKVTRILGAYKDGRLPSIDSVTDARVYSTMMARIREKGAWPGWGSAHTTTEEN